MMTIGRSFVGPDHIVRDEMHGDVAGLSCQTSPYGRAILAKAVDGCSQTDQVIMVLLRSRCNIGSKTGGCAERLGNGMHAK